MIKLNNTEWIGNQICNDIPKWDNGNIITIESGTGSGKSHFIKNDLYNYAKGEGDKILLLVHRLNTYTQFSIELKKGRKFDVFSIMTYQTIEAIEKKGERFDFSKYKYIVCDEFHYFTSDSSQNNSTNISLNAILDETSKTRIFMSATGDLMIDYLKKRDCLDIMYVADIDFSFIDNLYFYSKDSTEDRLFRDLSEDGSKTIAFVNDLERLEELYLQYEDISLFNCSKSASKYRYVDNDKLNNMFTKGMFDETFLFSTSAMDTGVSLKDRSIKSIVCNNIVDMDTLVQVLGRKRILDKNDKVDVYIRLVDNRSLNGYLKKTNDKLEPFIDLAKLGDDGYIKKYEREEEDKSIVYYGSGAKVKYNDIALTKFAYNKRIYESMLKDGYKTHVLEALDRGESNYIDIEKEMETHMLRDYLNNIEGKRLYKQEQEDLSSLIINQLVSVGGGVDYRTRLLRPTTLESLIRQELELPYAVSKPRTENKTIDGVRTRRNYIVITRIKE